MPDNMIDFEGSNTNVSDNNSVNNTVAVDNTTHLNGGGIEDITSKSNDGNPQKTNNDNKPNDVDVDNTITHDLEVGTEIVYDGNVYTVAENGDIVDKDGKVFKANKDVKDWIDDNSTTDNDGLSISSIKDAIGIDITDENGNAVDFSDDANGVKNYIDAVINLRSNDIQVGAINKLFNDMPILKQFIDYVQLNGTPRGFGEIPDRRGIVLDKNNENQLEAVIRMAASEFGNNSMNDNYINYLKTTGSLYDEAVVQLDNLIKKDEQVRYDMQQRAEQVRKQEAAELDAYWKTVNDAITSRNINGYKLPESIVKEVNGKKVTLTLNDFYNYLSRPTEVSEDGSRITNYQKDLERLSDSEALNRELLDAWLMFTGGSYKDLIDMKVNEDKVRRLVITNKEKRNNHQVKVNKPKPSKVSADDLLLS